MSSRHSKSKSDNKDSKKSDSKSKSDKKDSKKSDSKSKSSKKDKAKGKEEKGDMKPKTCPLSVPIYQPQWGNLHHWALHLGEYNYVYQVTGEAMNFVADCRANTDPQDSSRWIESVHVADINEVDVPALHSILTNLDVQNDVQGWCCQDYVLEGLEALNAEQIVDDDEYEKARRRLMRRFNN